MIFIIKKIDSPKNGEKKKQVLKIERRRETDVKYMSKDKCKTCLILFRRLGVSLEPFRHEMYAILNMFLLHWCVYMKKEEFGHFCI